MQSTFGRLLGVDLMPARATATAAVTQPAYVGPGFLAPFAVSNCLFDQAALWDKNRLPFPGPVGPPYQNFVIASAAANAPCAPTCYCGQWTSLTTGVESAAAVKNMIDGGDQTPSVGIADGIYIQSGTEASLYDSVETYYLHKVIAVPVVSSSAIQSSGNTPLITFACLYVDMVVKGGPPATSCSFDSSGNSILGAVVTNKCVIGHFVETCNFSGGGGGGGPFTGPVIPPRLVQ